jgi:hypothetical protein
MQIKMPGGVRHIALPETGSSGLILRNQMNLVGGEMQPGLVIKAYRRKGIGNWTAQASSQLSRSDVENSHTEARVSSLFYNVNYRGNQLEQVSLCRIAREFCASRNARQPK